MRYLEDCPDGDRRKPDADRRVRQLLDEMHAAERAAGEAADKLIEWEDGNLFHGTAPPDDSVMGYTMGEDQRPRRHAR